MPGPRSVPPSRFITTTTCYPDNPPPPSLPILLQTRPGCPARHLFCRQFKALGVVAPNPLPRGNWLGHHSGSHSTHWLLKWELSPLYEYGKQYKHEYKYQASWPGFYLDTWSFCKWQQGWKERGKRTKRKFSLIFELFPWWHEDAFKINLERTFLHWMLPFCFPCLVLKPTFYHCIASPHVYGSLWSMLQSMISIFQQRPFQIYMISDLGVAPITMYKFRCVCSVFIYLFWQSWWWFEQKW